jgi:hypothetical protein
MRKLALLAVLLLVAGSAYAQAPTSLPGFSVSGFVGYTAVQGQNSGNGIFTSFAVPLKTIDTKWSFTIAARLDNFILTAPTANVVLGGPEARFQFSSANFMDGQVFQPFGNFMLGADRAGCVSTQTCAAGTSTNAHFAWKAGFGLDIVTSTHTTWRLIEVDHIQLPTGAVNLGNQNQFLTAFGFHF